MGHSLEMDMKWKKVIYIDPFVMRGYPVSNLVSGTFNLPVLLYMIWGMFSFFHTILPDIVFRMTFNASKNAIKPGKALRVFKLVGWEHREI